MSLIFKIAQPIDFHLIDLSETKAHNSIPQLPRAQENCNWLCHTESTVDKTMSYHCQQSSFDFKQVIWVQGFRLSATPGEEEQQEHRQPTMVLKCASRLSIYIYTHINVYTYHIMHMGNAFPLICLSELNNDFFQKQLLTSFSSCIDLFVDGNIHFVVIYCIC